MNATSPVTTAYSDEYYLDEWQGKPITGDRLFDLQIHFNLFPSAYAHSTWLDRAGAHLPAEFAFTERCDSVLWLRRLSYSLLRACELEEMFDFDFHDRAKRIALLDSPRLVRVGKLVAALLVRERLKRVVLGDEIATVEQTLGREAHRFALQWNELVPQLSFILHKPDDPWPDQARWTRGALRLISALVPSSAPGTLARLEFKFPYEWTKLKRFKLSDADRVNLGELFISVFQRVEPELSWLFAPSEA